MTQDITVLQLLYGLVLVLPVLAIIHVLRLGLLKPTLVGVARMALQLLLVGFVLIWVFRVDSAWLNLAWMLSMLIIAARVIIRRSELPAGLLFITVTLSLFISVSFVLGFFLLVLLRLPDPFTARYLITVGGMLLGNSMTGNIVALSTFYQSIERNRNRYLYHLSLGASRREVLIPYWREAMKRALNPTIAVMMTMGLVTLPGMMTGQILGGASPGVAVRYQIAIMLSILANVTISSAGTLFLSRSRLFHPSGVLREVNPVNPS